MSNRGRKVKKAGIAGQSVIEYLIILVVVAVLSIIFAKTFLYDADGKFILFAGYVAKSTETMKGAE